MSDQKCEIIGIAIAPKIMADMETRDAVSVAVETGIDGDARGKKEAAKFLFSLKTIGMMLLLKLALRWIGWNAVPISMFGGCAALKKKAVFSPLVT